MVKASRRFRDSPYATVFLVWPQDHGPRVAISFGNRHQSTLGLYAQTPAAVASIQPVLPVVVTQDGVPAQSGLSVATI
jgi:NADH:ubiquinone oxidoreductase subunit B-like Fe-S oxidoreductase